MTTNTADPGERDSRIAAIFADPHLRGVIIQPYLNGVETGELSATFVGQDLVVAVKKIPGFGPAQSNTRVALTDDATLARVNDLGRRALTAITNATVAPVRIRLDVIPQLDGLRLLEAEMVDPNCNLTSLGSQARAAAVHKLAQKLCEAIHDLNTL